MYNFYFIFNGIYLNKKKFFIIDCIFLFKNKYVFV